MIQAEIPIRTLNVCVLSPHAGLLVHQTQPATIMYNCELRPLVASVPVKILCHDMATFKLFPGL